MTTTLYLLDDSRSRWFRDNGLWTTYVDPEEVSEFTIDYTELLHGDTIDTSTWVSDGALGISDTNATDSTVTITISQSSGVAKNVITTTGGKKIIRRFQFLEMEM